MFEKRTDEMNRFRIFGILDLEFVLSFVLRISDLARRA